MLGLLLTVVSSSAGLPVPHLDHSKAVSVRPLNANVVVCTTPNPLGFVRQIVAANPTTGDTMSVLYDTRCSRIGSTGPWSADFVETAEWSRFISTGNVAHGTIEVVRLRKGSAYFYGAVEDFRVGA